MNLFEKGEQHLARLSEERFYLILLSSLAFVMATAITIFALGLHWNFLTIACDTAAYQNTLANLLQGNGFRDTAYNGPNFLGQHNALILLALAPFYAVFPSPSLLFVLQVWGLYCAVVPLYLLAVDLLRRPLAAFLVALLAVASPLFLQMSLAPFHTESWILPLVLWSWIFYRRNQARWFWLCFFGAVSCGEQAALIYIAMGALWWLAEDGLAWHKKYAAFAVVGAFLWLVLSVGLLVPAMRVPSQFNIMNCHYAQWGIQTAPELAKAILHDPAAAFALVFSPARWLHVGSLVGLPLLFAFFSWRSLLLLLPFPFFFLMCVQEYFLYFHAYYYQFAFLAGFLGLVLFLRRWELSMRLGIVAVTATVLVNLMALCPAIGFYQTLAIGEDEAFNETVHAAFDRIPPDAAVYSPHRYSAYLSNRPNMVMGDLYNKDHDFKAMLDANFATTNVHPEQIDFIVSDLQNDQCGWRQASYNPEAIKLRTDTINELLKSGQWQVFWSQNNVVILQRKETVPHR